MVQSIDREDLKLPRVVIDDFVKNPEKMLKTSFDRIWNACGYPNSLHYDKNGNWIEK